MLSWDGRKTQGQTIALGKQMYIRLKRSYGSFWLKMLNGRHR